MRGKLEGVVLIGQNLRITPAGAGKTKQFLERITSTQDHPRRCGENTAYKSSSSYHLGSPPQVRGKPNDETSISAHTGITPAGAGKTCFFIERTSSQRDHPRRCGENATADPSAVGLLGSPPQVRGKHTVYFMSSDKPRITPAGAGKTIIT